MRLYAKKMDQNSMDIGYIENFENMFKLSILWCNLERSLSGNMQIKLRTDLLSY